MGIGSGLGASFGMAAEAAYGTYVAPTSWVELSTIPLGMTRTMVQGGAMAAGRYGRPGSMRHVASQAASGTLTMPMFSRRMGMLLNGLMGGDVVPVQQEATAAYLASFPLSDPAGKSYSMQVGVPDATGTVRPYTYLGCKILAIEWTCAAEDLTMSVEVDARQVVEDEVLAAPAYAVDAHVFHFAQSAVKLGVFGAEALVDGISQMSLRIGRPSKVDRYYHGGTGLKAEPRINDYVAITGQFTVDFLNKADFADRYAQNTPTSLVWEFTGPPIAAGHPELFRIKVPMIFLDGATPAVAGPDVVNGQFPWVGLHDGTHSDVTIDYVSADITL